MPEAQLVRLGRVFVVQHDHEERARLVVLAAVDDDREAESIGLVILCAN